MEETVKDVVEGTVTDAVQEATETTATLTGGELSDFVSDHAEDSQVESSNIPVGLVACVIGAGALAIAGIRWGWRRIRKRKYATPQARDEDDDFVFDGEAEDVTNSTEDAASEE